MTKKKPATGLQEKHEDYGFLWLMRWLERHADDKPRIGHSRRLREEIVHLGQDPIVGFSYSDLTSVDLSANTPEVRANFLGFFGPQGPLPMSVTREADYWAKNGDKSFIRFVDIFAARFIQLFYRSWSNARAITQFDHVSGGTFPDQLRAFTGDAGLAYKDRGAINDTIRLNYSPLLYGRVKSPTRLSKALELHFGLPVEIEEFAATVLEFAQEELSLIGLQSMELGRSIRLGAHTTSLSEKIVLHFRCRDIAEYQNFLPGREHHRQLVDLVRGYIGGFFDVDVALWIQANTVPQFQIGKGAELGWTTAIPEARDKKKGPQFVQACKYILGSP